MPFCRFFGTIPLETGQRGGRIIFTDPFFLENRGRFEEISLSTNRVCRFSHGGKEYILKENRMSPDALSPFWYGLWRIFGSDFDTQRKNIQDVLAALKENPFVAVPALAGKSERCRCLVFEKAPGMGWDPDTFPGSREVQLQLGRYIGFLHSRALDRFGAFPPPEERRPAGFIKTAALAMEEMISRFWAGRKEAEEALSYLCSENLPREPEEFCLMMADISANQFTFSPDYCRIEAVVDFDAYVAGPREWELSILELCLEEGEAFREGYETWLPMPDLTGCRRFYRLFSYLCDPWEEKDLSAFLKGHLLF